jgi:hypothetical protein
MVSSRNSDGYDVITSVAIPLAHAASSMLMILSFNFRLESEPSEFIFTSTFDKVVMTSIYT